MADHEQIDTAIRLRFEKSLEPRQRARTSAIDDDVERPKRTVTSDQKTIAIRGPEREHFDGSTVRRSWLPVHSAATELNTEDSFET
ncbi:hypothetical protein [Bradyrhizobium yuanmingense]|uniref:hypothetical protein n=1 Tax=Bradyrhizobium yuanmingense TaxID=108015 RepID=UPI0035114878